MDIIKELDKLKLDNKIIGLNKDAIQKRYNISGDYYLYSWDNKSLQLSKKINDREYNYITTKTIKDKELVEELKVLWYMMNM